jgi:hypothetical protein
MRNFVKNARLILFGFAFAPLHTIAQVDAPLQLDMRVPVKSTGLGVSLQRPLEPGGATVSVRVRNLPGKETALVRLTFNYAIKADFALDEIISLVVITIEDSTGGEFSRATIDPNTVSLNPNREPLSYSATLYTPTPEHPHADYTLRVQVFGNYE